MYTCGRLPRMRPISSIPVWVGGCVHVGVGGVRVYMCKSGCLGGCGCVCTNRGGGGHVYVSACVQAHV